MDIVIIKRSRRQKDYVGVDLDMDDSYEMQPTADNATSIVVYIGIRGRMAEQRSNYRQRLS